MNRLELVANVAVLLMQEHGLFGWKFKYSNSRRKLGLCKYNRKHIVLSKPHVIHGDLGDVFDTVRHEIAHALVGSAHGHDEVWQAKAVELGATPLACGAVPVPPRWKAVCPSCCKVHRRNIKRRGYTYHCRACGPDAGKLTYTRI